MDEKQALLPNRVVGERKFKLVIHGGAGTMDKSRSTIELRAKYKAALQSALLAGYGVLRSGGEAMDAAGGCSCVVYGGCVRSSSLASRHHASNRVPMVCL